LISVGGTLLPSQHPRFFVSPPAIGLAPAVMNGLIHALPKE
jgi:hypothetical protein